MNDNDSKEHETTTDTEKFITLTLSLQSIFGGVLLAPLLAVKSTSHALQYALMTLGFIMVLVGVTRIIHHYGYVGVLEKLGADLHKDKGLWKWFGVYSILVYVVLAWIIDPNLFWSSVQ